jgi:hypothetical protein
VDECKPLATGTIAGDDFWEDQLWVYVCIYTFQILLGRGLHSTTFRLNSSAFCGTRDECRGCLGVGYWVLGGNRGCLAFLMRQK